MYLCTLATLIVVVVVVVVLVVVDVIVVIVLVYCIYVATCALCRCMWIPSIKSVWFKTQLIQPILLLNSPLKSSFTGPNNTLCLMNGLQGAEILGRAESGI